MANYLIIAGSSDIGNATASLLQVAGHRVFLTGRTEESIASIAAKLNSPYKLCDAANFEAVDEVVKQAIHEFGTLDGVVNCAGSLFLKAAHLTNQQQYQAVIDASLTTAFATVRAAAKHLISCGGSVVLISSAAAMAGFSNHEAIAAAKAGIIGLTRSAAATYAPNNLRFNAVAPGLTETRLTQSLTTNATSKKISEGMHALGRLGKAEDIARAICFFLDPLNDWITGQILAVDGGLSSVRPKNHL